MIVSAAEIMRRIAESGIPDGSADSSMPDDTFCTCHPGEDRVRYAHGLCLPEYKRQWKARKRQEKRRQAF